MSQPDIPTRTTLTLRGPADLLCELPGLLSYHPNDSLVVVVTKDRSVAARRPTSRASRPRARSKTDRGC